jgi:hypothetical protein
LFGYKVGWINLITKQRYLRAYSTSDAINHHFNIIPHCIALGQAAGTAAAMAASASIQPRQVDYAVLQQRLKDQGVYIG